jgi:mannose-1-phosphate guanylyltransferase
VVTVCRVQSLWVIVPAGGAGTRLWPLSRAGAPKFLLDLTGSGRTLLQQTWDRLEPLAGADQMLVVTGQAHAAAVAEQLPKLPAEHLLAEPSARDSAAAIGLAAAVVAAEQPDAVVGSFAADHLIADQAAFAEAVRQAVLTAEQGYVVTLGIEPTYAATGFGYIRAGDLLGVEGAPQAHQVLQFVEKPDAETAAGYLAAGGYRWNAGMFVVRAQVLLDQLAAHRPALHAGLLEIAAAWRTPQQQTVLERVWPTLEKVAIDYAVAEPAAAAGTVAVVPADLGWHDIGDFAALTPLVTRSQPTGQGRELHVLGDHEQVSATDAGGLVVATGGRRVVVLGLDDVVVVDTPDAVLVTSRESAQQVKAIVDALRAAGRTDLL